MWASNSMEKSVLVDEVARFPWYHTLDLGGGVVTPGMFDHRPVVGRYLIPEDLSGMRCLDVGTMDGFWAFEMERRGADEVVALDIGDPDDLDLPVSLRSQGRPLETGKHERFSLARDALGSKVRRELGSVYEIGRDLGRFDLVLCSDVLLHLKDPITALERICVVTVGSAIVCNPIVRSRLGDRRPLAEIDGIDEFRWWIPNLAGLVRMVRSAGFPRVEAGRSFELPARGGGRWKGLRGVVRGFAS